MYARSVAVATLLFSIVAAGCHRGGFTNAPAGTTGAVGLTVQNQNFYDMDVYVVSEGLATRVGDVTGNSTGDSRSIRRSFRRTSCGSSLRRLAGTAARRAASSPSRPGKRSSSRSRRYSARARRSFADADR